MGDGVSVRTVQTVDGEARRERRPLVVGYYTAFVALGLFSGVLGPTLPALADRTSTTIRQISFVITAHGLGYILGSVLGGWLYDRLAGHRVMTAALAVMAVTLTLVPLQVELWLLIGIVLSLSLAEGCLDVGGNTMLVWAFGEEVPQVMNGLHGFFGVGGLLSPLVVAQVMNGDHHFGWAYWLLAPLMVVPLLMLLRLPSPKIPPPDETVTGSVNYGLVLLLALVNLFGVGAEVSFFSWIYTYGTELRIVTPTGGAYLSSVAWAAFVAGRMLAVPVSAHIGPRDMLLICIPGAMVGIGLILLLPGAAWVWIGVALFGLGLGPVFASLISLAERTTRVTGQVTGIFFIGGSLGMMIIPWLVGQLIAGLGPWVTVPAIIASMSMALLMLLTLLAARRGAQQRQG